MSDSMPASKPPVPGLPILSTAAKAKDPVCGMLVDPALMGTPAALGTITETYGDLEINGLFLGPETRQDRGELDYLDYDIDLSFSVPRSFGGVSGGGVWYVWVYWTPTGEAIDWKMSLLGVAFYELPIVVERRPMRCHGPKQFGLCSTCFRKHHGHECHDSFNYSVRYRS